MTARRLTAVDAQTYWLSRAVPSDQFLLFAFERGATCLDDALGAVRDRARACEDLRLRIDDAGFWTYPAWVPRHVDQDQFVVHALDDPTWAGCLKAVPALADDQLDVRVRTWRLHIFGDVEGLPRARGRGTVAVLQISHALADGVRASALAARLFGRDGDVPTVAPTRRSRTVMPVLAFAAGRAHRRLVRDTESGLVPPQAFPRPVLRTNRRPEGDRQLRTVVCGRQEIRGPTVTVGVLAAIGTALAAHLRELGDDPSQLGAEVPMAKSGPRRSNNHYGNVGVGLHPDAESGLRVQLIAAELAARRRRAAHPAMRAEAAAFAALPAPLLRWGVGQFDPATRWDTVIGNTVVSSVNRGPADLAFGDASVVFTAALPALSPMMGLTHGVHGIADTVTVSVHGAESCIGDIDAYVERLAGELR
ncbi:WS/DGAT domain-containing protein [Mycolicibacterium sp. BiH015]|uniref:wax ester/triacylglycerol synthase domain-containing protein n=1 Tax=Mycolicibacterium sp. BiH015 TaxID=3018808 RepID=UPI0022E7D1AF|nr:wax ester/triacylglycerol synthase domain-containing protein [Mycolicibacterium sp. BiH015]MDA2892760.1 WS/DGAT domain-containing protein [Mycolicibacterium sp. BiH015]